MCWLINYLRSCFCKHNWEMIFDITVRDKENTIRGYKKIYRCTQCGYSKKYKTY